MSVTTSAPALMNGLRGTPCSYSSCTSELNGLPDGSLPTRCHSASPYTASTRASMNALEMLWMEKRLSLWPVAYSWPSSVATAIANCCGSSPASAGM